MKFTGTATPSGIQPLAMYWEEYEDALKNGEEYTVTVKKDRSHGNNARFYAFLTVVLRGQDKYKNLEDLKIELKLKAGHYREHITTKGILIYIPKTLKFDSVDENEFKEFFNKCINAVLDPKSCLCPKGTTREDLEQQMAILNFG